MGVRKAANPWPLIAVVALVVGGGVAAGLRQRQPAPKPAPKAVYELPLALTHPPEEPKEPEIVPLEPTFSGGGVTPAVLEEVAPDEPAKPERTEAESRALYHRLVEIQVAAGRQAQEELVGKIIHLAKGQHLTTTAMIALAPAPKPDAWTQFTLVPIGTRLTVMARNAVDGTDYVLLRESDEMQGWCAIPALFGQGDQGKDPVQILEAVQARTHELEMAGREPIRRETGMTDQEMDALIASGNLDGWGLKRDTPQSGG